MNLNKIQPKNETEDLLLSLAKNCEILIEQNHKKAEEALEFKLTESRETFSFNQPVEIKENWMIGLINLGVYNSIFNITEKKTKFNFMQELSTMNFHILH